MTSPVQPSGLGPINPVNPTQTTQPAGRAGQTDFKDVLLNSLDEVNKLQKEADQGVQRLISGETDNVAEVFAAVNKASVAFDLLMEIRNKLQEAYRDIQQMRV